MADIAKAQAQLSRFLARNPEWETLGSPGLATIAQKTSDTRGWVRYSLSFSPTRGLWRSDVTISGQVVIPPKGMRSAGFYATPAQAAKGCEAMERSQYTA